MRIPAAVIMRNEAVLIASKLALCAAWADEIVVVDQLFYDAVGGKRDPKACEQAFSRGDLALGRMLYENAHAQNAPRKRWWHKWL